MRFRSATVLSLLIFTGSGAAFALANLLLARSLPEREYAVFTLALALMHLGSPLAGVGLDGVAVRGRLATGPAVLGRVLLAASVVALGLGAAGAVYAIDLAAIGTVMVSTAAGGAMTVAAAELQRRQWFGTSLGLMQIPNLALLLAAVMVMVTGGKSALPALALTAAGFAAGAVAAWTLVLRRPAPGPDGGIPWREAFSLGATNASGLLLGQLDRLIIPYLLPLSALATYGALSAVVGSLFRVLQRGVGYALLPRLRAAETIPERRQLIAQEARMVGAIVVLGSAAIWLVIPFVEQWVLAGRYRFPDSLVLAALVAGWAKLLTAFSRATVTALADQRQLALVNLSGWASVALSVVGAVAGARWGLTGVIYGVSLGWLVRSVAALAITFRHLHPVTRAPVG
jgi:O-antigen/teichoic acid export membrane protein